LPWLKPGIFVGALTPLASIALRASQGALSANPIAEVINELGLTALILLVASLLAGVVTAFAGPIGFIGVASPHLARPLVRTSDHRALLPASAMIGSIMALVAAVAAQTPSLAGVLPLNAITAILGVPVVIWVLTRRSRTEAIT